MKAEAISPKNMVLLTARPLMLYPHQKEHPYTTAEADKGVYEDAGGGAERLWRTLDGHRTVQLRRITSCFLSMDWV